MEKKEQPSNTSNVGGTHSEQTGVHLTNQNPTDIPTKLPPQPNFTEWPRNYKDEETPPPDSAY
jgi:hypothetical protein